VQFVKDQFHPAELDVRQQQRGEIMKQTPHPVKHFSKNSCFTCPPAPPKTPGTAEEVRII
ncbi:MAG: hypothetical protein H6R13_3522, partial [Proteobacteria bacterium]|nr:hypothetical protein [Pseudomonadota bacterium]